MNMIQRISLIALLFLSLFTGCKDDDPAPYRCTECVDQPEANAAYDNTGQGIYKGIVVGSSGTIKFDIANNGTTVTGVLVIDGTTVTLSPNGSFSPSTGFQGSFTGTLNGGMVIIPFSVNASGEFTVSSGTIPGHTGVIFKLIKEKSTQLVEVFEGEYGGAGSIGTFNLVMIRNQAGVGEWIAISRSDTYNILTGVVEDDGIFGGNGEIVVAGEIAGDKVSGVWEDVTNETNGKWEGKRTL